MVSTKTKSYFEIFIHFFFTEALKLYRGKLTAYEQTEILDYPEIYFLGLEAKKVEGVPGGSSNNGYDDDSGSYIKVSGPVMMDDSGRHKVVENLLKFAICLYSNSDLRR